MKRISIFLIFLPIIFYGQKIIEPLNVNEHKTSMRGLYNVNKNTTWASGTGGVILIYNKNKWKVIKEKSFENLDFRDIHAFNKKEAVIMSSGDGCEIYKTSNGGEKWVKVYENKEEGIFFDGMDFWDDKNGLAFSDPINNQLYIISTNNGGSSWKKLTVLPNVLDGEAGFAASGTGIVCKGDSTVFIGTGGGKKVRVLKSTNRGRTWKTYDTPLRGGNGYGIYSMSFIDEKNGVVIGGNYFDSTYTNAICAVTNDGGITWELVNKAPPKGYRSCVTHNGKDLFISCGRTGIDISKDGKTWIHVSDDAYYSCVANGDVAWLTGRKGKIAKMNIEQVKNKVLK